VMMMEYTHHVEVRKKDNEGLANPDVVKVRIFIGHTTVNGRKEVFNGVIAGMKRFIIEPPQGLDNSILKGMVSQEQHGYFTVSHLNKLLRISNQYDINLCIPKIWKTLITEYTSL